MLGQLEMAYIGIEAPDPSGLDDFFGAVIGLEPGDPTAAGATTWRNDDRAQRVIVQAGPANDVAFIGLEATSADAFDETLSRLARAGYEASDGDAEERRVERMKHVTTPWGVRLEIAQGLAQDKPFQSALVPGGFLTDGVGFGHVVNATTDLEASHRFLTEGLGFGQSDWLEMPLGPDMTLEVRFYHCNGRHHSLALAAAPFELPQKLHHIMFETNTVDDTGHAFDRAWESGLPLPNGLGRHDNDGMFSFYVASPAGWQVEVGHGARTVTADWDDNRVYDRISAWGHQPLRSA